MVYVVQMRLDFESGVSWGVSWGRCVAGHMRLFTLDAGTDVGTTSSVADVAALPGAGQVHVGPRDTRVLLAGVQIGDVTWDAEIRFEAQVISRVELVARCPAECPKLGGVVMDQEIAEAFHEEWACAGAWSAKFSVRIEVDGKWISTEWPARRPSRRRCPGGSCDRSTTATPRRRLPAMMIGFVGG